MNAQWGADSSKGFWYALYDLRCEAIEVMNPNVVRQVWTAIQRRLTGVPVLPRNGHHLALIKESVSRVEFFAGQSCGPEFTVGISALALVTILAGQTKAIPHQAGRI